MEDGERVEFGGVVLGSGELTVSGTAVLLFLRVVTVAPLKLFIRAEVLLRGVVMRFRAGLASVDASPELGETLEPRLDVVLMLAAGDAKVDTPGAVSVVTDAPCD